MVTQILQSIRHAPPNLRVRAKQEVKERGIVCKPVTDEMARPASQPEHPAVKTSGT